jgi:PAS domain S-box-containing protein
VGGTLNLLLVEDSESDHELVVLELRRYGFDVAIERVDSDGGLRRALAERCWDIVVCDHGLPGFDSREALHVVQAEKNDLPFVVLSGSIGEEAAVDALRSGARDVVLKSNLARLGPVVDRELVESRNRRRQREAEEALQISEARKSAILDSALDAVIAIDHEGVVVDFNPAAERMFGYERIDVVGRDMAGLIVPESLRERHLRGLERLAAGGEAAILGRRVELTGMRADGSEFPVELSITRGELFGRPFFTGYVRDLTERRRAEEERASLEEQLRQAQKMDAIGSLAGSITHDFNNILAVVNGYSELVLRRLGPGDPLRPQIEEIARAGEKAAALTRQLLAFTRRQVLEPRVLDLNEVVADLEPLLRRMVGEHVELVTRLGPEVEPVRADESQLEQVIMNLAVNARDAMPDGGTLAIETTSAVDGPSLCVGRAVIAPDGPCALLSVADTGPGVEPGLEQRIFEPFFTTKAVGRGTGLGLSTVYGIVEQSGGCVWVDSAPGKGAVFNVCLPLATAPAPAIEPSPPPQRHERSVATVLVVEDDEGLLRLVSELLEHDGFAVRSASSADEALALFAADGDAIEVVVTDVVMPGMGGIELGRELRAARPDLKLLFMSGYSEERLAEGGPDRAGTGFIQKPFAPATLDAKLRELLD